MKENKTNLAPVFSFLVPGLGQIYQGSLLLGYIFFILYILFFVLSFTYSYWWLIISLIIQIVSTIGAHSGLEWD